MVFISSCKRAFFGSGVFGLVFIAAGTARSQDQNPPAGSEGGGGFQRPLGFQADIFTGRFTHSIPIEVPPAHGGKGPQLALSYSSSGDGDLAGTGWSFDPGYVQRDLRKGVPVNRLCDPGSPPSSCNAYDDRKGIVFSLLGQAGKLTRTNSTQWDQTPVWHPEVDRAYLEFLQSTGWGVTDTDGTFYSFGGTPESRMMHPNFPQTYRGTNTFKWALSEMIDTYNRRTWFYYFQDAGQLYLERVSYGSATNGSPTHFVDFLYENRPDVAISYKTGYRVETRKRLKEVVVRVGESRVRSYALSYIQSPSTTRSLLSRVTEFGADGVSALPPVSFSYQVKPFEFGPLEDWGLNESQGNQGDDVNSVRGRDMPTNSTWPTLKTDLRDIDADGLPDRVMRKLQSPFDKFFVQYNQGDSFESHLHSLPIPGPNASSPDWSSLHFFKASPGHGTILQFADMNGDGFDDRVMLPYDASNYGNFQVQLSNRWGWSPPSLWGPLDTQGLPPTNDHLSWFCPGGGCCGLTWTGLIDMNADGLPDRLMRPWSGPYDKQYVQLNTGFGFSARLDWAGVTSQGQQGDWNNITYVHDGDTLVGMYDLNGDGLPDRVMRKASPPYDTFVVQWNTGIGYAPAESWGPVQGGAGDNPDFRSPNGSFTSPGHLHNVAVLVDINGDKLPDRVIRNVSAPYNVFKIQVNNGRGFEPLRDMGPLESQGSALSEWNCPLAYDGGGKDDTIVDLVDIDGDGLVDRVMRKLTGPNHRLYVQRNKGPLPDLLSSIDNGIGGTISAVYKPSTAYDNRDRAWNSDPWSEGAVSLLPFPVQTVSTVTTNDGMGHVATTQYFYQGGMYDHATREFRGFHKVEVLEPSGRLTKTFFHQGGGWNGSAQGEFSDTSKAKAGMPYRVEVWGSDGIKYQETINRVFHVSRSHQGPYGGEWLFASVQASAQVEYAPGGSSRARLQSFYYDDKGRLYREDHHGEIANYNPATHLYTEVPGDEVYVNIAYATLTNESIISKPQSIKTSSDPFGNQKLKETIFEYHWNGNVSKRYEWLDTSNSNVLQESFAYGFRGNVTSRTDAAGLVTSYVYDSAFQIFPATATTSGFVTSFVYDARSGKMTRSVDYKGLVTEFVYDTFHRLRQTLVSQAPNGPANVWKQRVDYDLSGVSNGLSRNSIRQRVQNGVDPTNGQETVQYFDGLFRKVQARAQAENGQYRVRDSWYDSSGHLSAQPHPYFSPGSDFTPRNPNLPMADVDYDAIHRPFRYTPPPGDSGSPIGPQTLFYQDAGNPWRTKLLDAENRGRVKFVDAFGRTSEIREIRNGGETHTHFESDLLGNLLTITDDSGNRTRNQYDSLGRKIWMEDPDMGVWTYEYDAAGRMVRQVDAKNQRTEFFYESLLGRIHETKIYKASGTLEETIRYSYDSGENVYPSQLALVTDGQGETRYAYDVRGRVKRIHRFFPIELRSLTVEYVYNDADRVIEMIYPEDSGRVQYLYDAAGHVRQVLGLFGSSGSQVLYEALGFTAMDQIGAIRYGNGNETHFLYYANSKRLEALTTFPPSGSAIQLLKYAYDKVGNVKEISDWVHYGQPNSSELRSIQYDEWNRLTSYEWNGTQVRSFQYDSIGNILSNSENGPGSYSYEDPRRPHAVTAANGKTYAYDANGNMVARGDQVLAYDAQNRLISVRQNGIDTRFGYTFDGSRLWKRQGDRTQIWIGNHYEEKDGRKLCHVIVDGRRIATIEDSHDSPVRSAAKQPVFWFYHGDHLGSASLVTDRHGQRVHEFTYMAFGKSRYSFSGSKILPTFRFTDQALDDETGLYFYRSRYYDPELGRFIQPDTRVQDPNDPQSINRYAYARNNPLKYTDPSGHFFQAAFIAALKGALIGGLSSAAIAAMNGDDVGKAFLEGAKRGALTGLVGGVTGQLSTFLTEKVGLSSGLAKLGEDLALAAIRGGDPLQVLSDFGAGRLVDEAGISSKTFGSKVLKGAVAGGLDAAVQDSDIWKGVQHGAVRGAVSAIKSPLYRHESKIGNVLGYDLTASGQVALAFTKNRIQLQFRASLNFQKDPHNPLQDEPPPNELIEYAVDLADLSKHFGPDPAGSSHSTTLSPMPAGIPPVFPYGRSIQRERLTVE